MAKADRAATTMVEARMMNWVVDSRSSVVVVYRLRGGELYCRSTGDSVDWPGNIDVLVLGG